MLAKVTYLPRIDYDPLGDLVADAKRYLRNQQIPILYPDALRKRHDLADWKRLISEICALNSGLLTGIANRGGVYAIWVEARASTNLDWELKYIGQTKGELSRQRIRSHLIWRNKETNSGRFTGSMFDQVRSQVALKREIALSYVEVDPETLRHFLESTLLAKYHPQWNTQGTILTAGLGPRRYMLP